KLADLFLDTLPYNAGTTASDALWSGLPVLTQAGNSFVGRMASSLLENIGLPELIAHSSKEYKQIAVELATNRDNLLAIKQRLIANKSITSLFNPGSFARSLESAYQKIFDRYCAGLSPEDVYVQS
ncbi:MAG: hypothetical protein EB101_08700, partial [Chitinophagia bacterium]|nr:hypothetical protein [Chitinophagia bacterium]